MNQQSICTITLTLDIALSKAAKGSEITVFTYKISGLIELPHTGTVVILDGGTTIPVKESKEEILKVLFQALIIPTTKE